MNINITLPEVKISYIGDDIESFSSAARGVWYESIVPVGEILYPVTYSDSRMPTSEFYNLERVCANLKMSYYINNKTPILLNNPWFYKIFSCRKSSKVCTFNSSNKDGIVKSPYHKLTEIGTQCVLVLFAKKCTKGYDGFVYIISPIEASIATTGWILPTGPTGYSVFNAYAGSSASMPQQYSIII